MINLNVKMRSHFVYIYIYIYITFFKLQLTSQVYGIFHYAKVARLKKACCNTYYILIIKGVTDGLF